jgi:hypothetical protein
MKRKVRITETQLNSIIKKALKEQEEMSTGPDPSVMTGSPEDEVGAEEGGEPNFEAFLSAAQELMGQGITIGALVDKLCEAKDTEGEPEPEMEPEVEPGDATDQDVPSNLR